MLLTPDSSSTPSGSSKTDDGLPAHGTYARANGRPRSGVRPCTCEPCSAKSKTYRKRRRYLTAIGHPLTVDAGPAAAHLRLLLDAGDDLLNITRRINYTYTPIKKVADGTQARLQRIHAEAILALKPRTPAGLYVDPIGGMRRVRALYAAGHSLQEIVEESGVSRPVLSALANGHRDRIARETADAIAAAYRRLCMTPGSSRATARRAAQKGWAPPLAWTEIDNPAALPDFTGHCGTLKGHRLHETCKIPICGPCRNVKAADTRERRERRAAECLESAA